MSERALITILIVLVGLFAGSTTFFATLHFSKKPVSATKEVSTTAQPESQLSQEQTQTVAPQANQSTSSSQPPNFSNLPVQPENTYMVEKKDTLFTIATKFSVSADELAKVNNLSDPNIIKFDQILVIPKIDKAAKVSEITFTQNDKALKSILQRVSTGQESSRKDPTETAKTDHGNLYGLGSTDMYTASKNEGQEAEVKIQHADEQFMMTLKKNEQGIWIVQKLIRMLK